MTQPSSPPDPEGELGQDLVTGARVTRQMFLAYVLAGFTDDQAMTLLLAHLSAAHLSSAAGGEQPRP
jgi:hypothetical protein